MYLLFVNTDVFYLFFCTCSDMTCFLYSGLQVPVFVQVFGIFDRLL